MDERERKELEKKIREINERFQEMGGMLDEEMDARLRDYREMLGKRSREVWEEARHRGRDVDHFVHEKPWQAAGIALGIGLVIGMIAGHRRD